MSIRSSIVYAMTLCCGRRSVGHYGGVKRMKDCVIFVELCLGNHCSAERSICDSMASIVSNLFDILKDMQIPVFIMNCAITDIFDFSPKGNSNMPYLMNLLIWFAAGFRHLSALQSI